MSMKMVCNRCNKVKEDGEHFNNIRYIRSDNHYDDSEYDLCPECSKLFRMFLDGGEVEEDRYKDSKPCAVVIHKLADGNYAIENAPDKKKNHCGTCAHQWDTNKCPRAKETPGTICCGNNAEGCDEWAPDVKPSINDEPDDWVIDKREYEDVAHMKTDMDKEESDLSVKMHKAVSGVYVPDSKPWGKEQR